MNVKLKTLLNETQHFNGFIYESVELKKITKAFGIQKMELQVIIREHKQRKPYCSQCGQPAPVYDHLPMRDWLHVPLIMNWFTFKKAFSSAAVEGLNKKVRVVTNDLMALNPFMCWKSCSIILSVNFLNLN